MSKRSNSTHPSTEPRLFLEAEPILTKMPEPKVFEPEIIEENPFPGDLPQLVNESQTVTGGNFKPTTVKDGEFPQRRAAIELLSSALNTTSKKILQEFKFTPSGAMQVGDFKEGDTGDLRLSPNGILGRDNAGITTFAIDGITGNAIFKGTIRAGTLITGEVIVGNNSVIIDGENKRILINDGTNDRVLIGFDEGGF